MKKTLVTAVCTTVVLSMVTPVTTAQAAPITCSSVHLIAVHDVNDSATNRLTDTGFLGDIVSPVVAAANAENVTDTSGGIVVSEKNTPTQLAEADWKPNVWGTPTGGISTANTTAKQTSSAPNPKAKAEVTRTYITLKSTSDTRAYIPGVTGPENVPSYTESVQDAANDVREVLTTLDQSCPSTKVALLGVGEGAQTVSIVANEIGQGSTFDQSKVLGVSMFADPSRAENQPTVANGQSTPAGASKAWNTTTAEGAGVAEVTPMADAKEATSAKTYGSLADRAVSWCMEGDTTCAIPKGTPLRTLLANTHAETAQKTPQAQLAYVAEVLGPAVALGTVEAIAEDINFGPNGFRFSSASTADETLIGRIAATSDKPVDQQEIHQRLVAAGAKIGGMALAAGITVAKEVITPANIAQVAAASAVNPAAGLAAAALIAAPAVTKLVSTDTITTGIARLTDEAKSVGVENEELSDLAVQAVMGSQTGKATYSSAAVTSDGASAATATTAWLLDLVGHEVGRDLSKSAGVSAPQIFDSQAVAAASAKTAK
ncbi:cutinase family protein [Corynebacterium ulcerans]|uniref:cutinase family protein n=1 Tax=Corynebacterium ulcerans TaxID=65058 RepID=UPI003D6F5F0F